MLRPVEKRENRVEKGVTFVCSTSSHFLVQVGLKDGYWHHDVALLGSPGVNFSPQTSSFWILESAQRGPEKVMKKSSHQNNDEIIRMLAGSAASARSTPVQEGAVVLGSRVYLPWIGTKKKVKQTRSKRADNTFRW